MPKTPLREVLLKSVPNLPKFDSPKALMVWPYEAAKNRCLMSRRKILAGGGAWSLDAKLCSKRDQKRE